LDVQRIPCPHTFQCQRACLLHAGSHAYRRPLLWPPPADSGIGPLPRSGTFKGPSTVSGLPGSLAIRDGRTDGRRAVVLGFGNVI
jgi:hypothetical protein